MRLTLPVKLAPTPEQAQALLTCVERFNAACDWLGGIALEDLQGIRERVSVRRRQRARHRNWAFAQLRSFVEYKAKLAGVPVVLVDPRTTSRTCVACGHADQHNRPSQARFQCVRCAFVGHADHVAARVIAARARAAVMQPNVGPRPGKVVAVGAECRSGERQAPEL